MDGGSGEERHGLSGSCLGGPTWGQAQVGGVVCSSVLWCFVELSVDAGQGTIPAQGRLISVRVMYTPICSLCRAVARDSINQVCAPRQLCLESLIHSLDGTLWYSTDLHGIVDRRPAHLLCAKRSSGNCFRQK